MNKVPELIVMLTYNDLTVRHASDIFEQCKNSKAAYWGFKEEGLPLEEMKALFGRMKACGKKTGLEVVAYTEDEGEYLTICITDDDGNKPDEKINDRIFDLEYVEE